MVNVLFFQMALVIYLLGTGASLAYLIWLKKAFSRAGGRLLLGGFLVQALGLFFRFAEAGYTPITSLHESLSFFAWLIVGLYLALHFRYRVEALAAFISPLAAVLILAASFFPKEIVPQAPILRSFWFPLHVTFAFIGNALFTLCFAVGVMYLIQERQIKSKRIGPFFRRLPSLQVLDELNARCLSLGFPFLTLGILTGSVWAESAWGSYWNWDQKETWSLITWLLYAALLHGRLTVGWRGRRAALWSIAGFAALLFTFLGVNLLFSDLHKFL